MQTIDAVRVHELLDYPGLVAALEQAHRGGRPKLTDTHVYEEKAPGGAADHFIILPAWQPGEGILAKLVTSFPENRLKHDLATVSSLYVFFNGVTGIVDAVIDGEAMIFRKTSADSALGSKLLARPGAETLLMMGAGGLAPYLVRAHLSVHPSIRKVLIWNRTPANAERLAASLRSEGIDAQVVPNPAEALSRADIVSSATMATKPHVLGEYLKPGAHIDLVGSFTPEMREADDIALQRAEIFVDHRRATERAGELADPIRRGIIKIEDVRGDLFDLCKGRIKGRTDPGQITLMKNSGGSHIDYFVAKYLMDRIAGRPFSTCCTS